LKKNKCSFCNIKESEEVQIVNGIEVGICLSCAEASIMLMSLDIKKNIAELKPKKELTPKDYKKILDTYVIGQGDAKEVLSVAIYNHIKRINNLELELDKSNILFIGPTGSGKTFLAETIAKHLDIPLAIVNTTSLTAAGYVGEDVSSVLERLWKDAGEDVDRAEKGIIFLDEIDKNATSAGGTNNKDVSGKAVQQELLKILEGDIVKIYPDGTKKNKKSGDGIEINTKDILFIAGGAFVGLKDSPGVQINSLNIKKKTDDGISNTKYQQYLDNFGLIPEFYGRFPNIVELDELDISTIESILTEPKNSIVSQYMGLFKLSNVEVEFTKRFLDIVAKEALEVKTGARGLRSIMENKLRNIMFNIDEYNNRTIIIDYKYNKVHIQEAQEVQEAQEA